MNRVNLRATARDRLKGRVDVRTLANVSFSNNIHVYDSVLSNVWDLALEIINGDERNFVSSRMWYRMWDPIRDRTHVRMGSYVYWHTWENVAERVVDRVNNRVSNLLDDRILDIINE